ncbi:MAG: GNAT family N-acetyltransferase, partial [Pseudomonadota bacterium]
FEPYQGRGIGKALIDLAWKEASRRRFKELSLIVFEQNQRALDFYHRLGFAEVARHPAPRHKALQFKCDLLMMVAPV